MSPAEYASKSFSILTKLAAMLRNIAAPHLIFAKFAALLRSDKGGPAPLSSEFRSDAAAIRRNTIDRPVAISDLPRTLATAKPKANDQFERERLIRQRWRETGIKLWNPDVHGAGLAALNIQGRVELLPLQPGETIRRYDKLAFKLNGSQIVCEGVAVDPPTRRGFSVSLLARS